MSWTGPTYKGTISASDSPGLGTEADFRITASLFTADSSEGHFEIHLDKLQFERNPSGKLLLYDGDDTSRMFWTDDERLLKDYFLSRHPRLRLELKEATQNRESRRNLLLAALFLLVVLICGLTIWLLAGRLAGFVVQKVPVKWEEEIGNAAYQQLLAESKVVKDPKARAQLDLVTTRLLSATQGSPYRFRFTLVDAEEPNAFAVPGGQIFVNTGLLKTITRPEQLAGVLAHEIAHVTKRHGVRQIVNSLGPVYIIGAIVGDGSGLLRAISGSSQMLLQQSFSREFEREADLEGWQLLLKAHVDPRGLEEFLTILSKDKRLQTAERVQPRVLSSHPPTLERIATLQDLAKKLPANPGYQSIESR